MIIPLYTCILLSKQRAGELGAYAAPNLGNAVETEAMEIEEFVGQ
jgi:hypothetical protein